MSDERVYQPEEVDDYIGKELGRAFFSLCSETHRRQPDVDIGELRSFVLTEMLVSLVANVDKNLPTRDIANEIIRKAVEDARDDTFGPGVPVQLGDPEC